MLTFDILPTHTVIISSRCNKDSDAQIIIFIILIIRLTL